MHQLRLRVRRLRRRILLHRRPLAALLAAAAILLSFRAATAPPPPAVTVLTASRDLPAGTVLTADDLSPTAYSPASVPDRSIRQAGRLVGRTLASPLRRGEPVTDLRVVKDTILDGYPGSSAVPVRIVDVETVAMLRVGDIVSLVGTDPQNPSKSALIAHNVPVIAIPKPTGGHLVSSNPGRLIVVAIPQDDLLFVTSTAVSQMVSVTWTR